MDKTEVISFPELLSRLESGDSNEWETARMAISDSLKETKDVCPLVTELLDYYLSSRSAKCFDIIVSIGDPHTKYLWDKLSDYLKSSTQNRLRLLELLSQLVRNTTYCHLIHKLARHSLFNNVIKLLKQETDLPTLMTALTILLVITLAAPFAVSKCLQDIFEIFSRLTELQVKRLGLNMPNCFLLHLNLGIYSLFHRLYGLFPCNFVFYLRSHYKDDKYKLQIFAEVIKPMLDSVRLHPMLLTATKEDELNNSRWIKMGIHDILADCSKITIDPLEASREDQNFSNLTQSAQLTNSTKSDFFSGKARAHADSFLTQSTNFTTYSPLVQEETLTPFRSPIVAPAMPPLRDASCSPFVVPAEQLSLSLSQGNADRLGNSGKFSGSGGGSPDVRKVARVLSFDDKENVRSPRQILSPRQSKALEASDNHTNGDFDHGPAERRMSVATAPGVFVLQGEETSFVRFVRNASRYRYISQCSGPIESAPVPKSTSCPNLHFEFTEIKEVVQVETAQRKISTISQGMNNEMDSFYPFAVPPRVVEFCKVCNDINIAGEGRMGEMPTRLPPAKCDACLRSLNPHEILDRHILQGSALHSLQTSLEGSSTPLPLTSGARWSHYEGNPTAEEAEALRGQIVLLHNQLMYERYKREIHAQRNRNMLSKVKAVLKLEEENKAMKEHIQLQDQEIKMLSESNKKVTEVNRQLEDKLEAMDTKPSDVKQQLSRSRGEVANLKNTNISQQSTIMTLKLEKDRIQNNCQKYQAMLFECQQDLCEYQERAALCSKLEVDVDNLTKVCLLQSEFESRYKDKLLSLQLHPQFQEQNTQFHKSCSAEILSNRDTVEAITNQLDNFIRRTEDLEAQVDIKDLVIQEQKLLVKNIKEDGEAQLMAIESKYQSSRSANQTLEATILELRNRVEILSAQRPERELIPRRKPSSVSRCEDAMDYTGGLSPEKEQQPGASGADGVATDFLGFGSGGPVVGQPVPTGKPVVAVYEGSKVPFLQLQT